MSEQRLFAPCNNLTEFDQALTKFHAGKNTLPVPVWVGDRADLLKGITLAEELYEALRQAPICSEGIFVSSHDTIPESVHNFARPLAQKWVSDWAAYSPSGSLLVVGLYEDLRYERIGFLIEEAHASKKDLFLLTGRDVHSLTWMIAKQYGWVTKQGEIGLFTELDTRRPLPNVQWFGAHEMGHEDIQSRVLDRTWQRVLFHGNGKDDSLNLGQFTVCGLSPVGRKQSMLGPKCAYGQGCYKPESKLISAQSIRAAEIVLSNCFSGALSDHAMYDPKYHIMLNAIDGPAQTVIATLTACDAHRPENVTWVLQSETNGNVARAINSSISDINPYPTFVQVGLISSGREHPNDHFQSDNSATDVLTTEEKIPLRRVGLRLLSFSSSDLIPQSHPLRPRLEKLKSVLLRNTARIVAESLPDVDSVLCEIEQEVQSLDLAIAQRIAKHPDDALLNFPTYFGERSVAGPLKNHKYTCACGRPLKQYTRYGRIPVILDTVQAVCSRCGDVVNAFIESISLSASSEDKVSPGEVLTVSVSVVADRSSVVNVGIALRPFLHATVRPSLRRLHVTAGEPHRANFKIELDPRSEMQAYYYIPFAVHDLGISTLRVHFGVTPTYETEAPFG